MRWATWSRDDADVVRERSDAFDLDADLFWSVWLNGKPTLLDRSQGEYGPRVGLPRILAMLARHDLEATFFVPGRIAERYPDAVSAIAEAGHEIAHHGHNHEDFSKLSAAEQREVLARGARALEAVTGRVPRGSRLIPGEDTAAILHEAGYLYASIMMDAEMPYRHVIDGKASDLIESTGPALILMRGCTFRWVSRTARIRCA